MPALPRTLTPDSTLTLVGSPECGGCGGPLFVDHVPKKRGGEPTLDRHFTAGEVDGRRYLDCAGCEHRNWLVTATPWGNGDRFKIDRTAAMAEREPVEVDDRPAEFVD